MKCWGLMSRPLLLASAELFRNSFVFRFVVSSSDNGSSDPEHEGKAHLPQFLYVRKILKKREGTPHTKDQASRQEIANMVEFLVLSVFFFF